jgi:hypothetical protein
VSTPVYGQAVLNLADSQPLKIQIAFIFRRATLPIPRSLLRSGAAFSDQLCFSGTIGGTRDFALARRLFHLIYGRLLLWAQRRSLVRTAALWLDCHRSIISASKRQLLPILNAGIAPTLTSL